MLGFNLLFVAAAMLCVWGVAHLTPTKSVVRGFGDISQDNRHIITMEWILEGVSLMVIGLLVGTVTVIDRTSTVSQAVYLISAIALLVFAAVSLRTGFKVKFLPFKLCPFIFTASAILIMLGGFVR